MLLAPKPNSLEANIFLRILTKSFYRSCVCTLWNTNCQHIFWKKLQPVPTFDTCVFFTVETKSISPYTGWYLKIYFTVESLMTEYLHTWVVWYSITNCIRVTCEVKVWHWSIWMDNQILPSPSSLLLLQEFWYSTLNPAIVFQPTWLIPWSSSRIAFGFTVAEYSLLPDILRWIAH